MLPKSQNVWPQKNTRLLSEVAVEHVHWICGTYHQTIRRGCLERCPINLGQMSLFSGVLLDGSGKQLEGQIIPDPRLPVWSVDWDLLQ